ncbi:GerAB/ArcD/ProY family transporter [Clostridium omnivorum]|uniref:Germination protein n=1 Tax=Clostridium omnivorum TaxID=1604902 RepID=A0ABQ5N153_9CLOT|nr:spore germination protein [Clostridium sp. E14]GLC28906.1 germination protein [Clostridium sp. E14]
MSAGSSKNQEMLSTSQFTFIVFGAIVGVGLLSLPNGVVKAAYQDGWISTLMGIWYPAYIFVAANFIAKKLPKENLMTINKKYFGKYIGAIINFLLFAYFMIFIAMIASYYTNIIRAFILGFLTPFKVLMVYYMIIIYASYKGMRAIGVISEITFYIIIVLVFTSIPALNTGHLTNIMPITDVSIKALLKGSWQSTFAYTGGEIIFLMYPFMKDRSKMKASSIFNLSIIAAIYTWVVFIAIFYFGPDIVEKFYWSFLEVTDVVTITAINNFRYIFLLLWSLVAFRSGAIYLFGGVCIAKNYLSEKKINRMYFILYPLLIYITLKFGNEANRQKLTSLITQISLTYNLVYITVMIIIVFFKERDKQ